MKSYFAYFFKIKIYSRLALTMLLAMTLAEAVAQTVSTDPEFPRADEEVTFSVDVTGTSLDGYNGDVWIWTWIERGSTDIDAPTNVNPATSNQSDALMTKVSSNPDVYEISFIPVDFFNSTVEELDQIGLKLKSQDWADNLQSDTDLFVTFNDGDLELVFTEPDDFPLFVDAGETFSITAVSSEAANLSIFIDDVEVVSGSGINTLSYLETAGASGSKTVRATASVLNQSVEQHFDYIVRGATMSLDRPLGIIDGINYSTDPTQVVLSLWAPGKSSVYVRGDFNNWEWSAEFLMNQDGEHFWLEIEDLTAGTEYGFQYLVDETVIIADPYADKILDPDDTFIPASSYPSIKPFPAAAMSADWFKNRISVLQTNQTPYQWQVVDYSKPANEELLIYELLIRDFLGENQGNYQAMIDTLSYIKNLGFNCVELMPIMEFNGNNSWGYNPTFMFAPDKFYGDKEDLKQFIDAAHGMDMVVVLDMVLNQNDVPAPYAAMYYDFNTFKPTADNPWFNVDATHPFNVFNDFNHESAYTQSFVDTVNHYWLNEFRFDGFRFDLSKGFTQTLNTDVGQWSSYDATRIAILKRMADKIWEHSPEAYVILEHFADNTEEAELSDYGMMLWGNAHFDYKEAILGFGENESIGWSYFQERGWTNNHLVSYMESHDEQRQMYEALNFGNSAGSYDVKDLETALDRLKLAASFFLTVPGPKMIWQFGEFGYDIDINENGRTGIKPTLWQYLDNANRAKLTQVYKELIKLRNLEVFKEGSFSWSPQGNLKTIHISHSTNDITIIGNFGITRAAIDPAFQRTGTWYDYFTDASIQVDDPNALFALSPGQFHILSREPLDPTAADLVPFRPDVVTNLEDDFDGRGFQFYPNPSQGKLQVIFEASVNHDRVITLTDGAGRVLSTYTLISGQQQVEFDLNSIRNGMYLLRITENGQMKTHKIVLN